MVNKMETQNHVESYDASNCDYDFDLDIDANKVYLDEYHQDLVDSIFYYLVGAAVNHRINQLDKNVIHSAKALLGDYFKEDDAENILAECCLDRLVKLGQVPVQKIFRNDDNDRKYILI